MDSLILPLDDFLILPYRLLDDPVWAWWLGTAVLAAFCIVLGEFTYHLGKRINRAHLEKSSSQAQEMEKKSMQALKAGDKGAYTATNKLANEAFGHTFFQHAALGASYLWPAFMAAGWMQKRFDGLEIPFLGQWLAVGWLQGFLICYLGLRLGLALWRWLAKRRRRAQARPA